MDAGSIYLASGAATVVNVFGFAVLWRGHRIEKATGKDPWWMGAVILGYAVAIASFSYAYKGSPVMTGAELFMASLCGQAIGVAVVYAVTQALWPARNSPWTNRAAPLLVAAFLGSLLLAGVLLR